MVGAVAAEGVEKLTGGTDRLRRPAAAKEDKPAPRARKISEDMIPRWAGNERRAAKGSKPRRKRKLSEGALEEQRLEDEARKQASMLLAPKSDKALKRRQRKERRRSRSDSMGERCSCSRRKEQEQQRADPCRSNAGSELSESRRPASDSEEEEEEQQESQDEGEDHDDEEEEEEEEPSAVTLFKNGKESSAGAASDDAPSASAKTNRAKYVAVCVSINCLP